MDKIQKRASKFMSLLHRQYGKKRRLGVHELVGLVAELAVNLVVVAKVSELISCECDSNIK